MAGRTETSPLCPEKGYTPKLQRTVGVLAASAVLFGNCVGAGIFISPKGVYEKAGSAGAGLVIWGLTGILATLCTLAYAELGTMIQQSGGEFVYINKAYGKLPAFLFSFCTVFLIKPASMSVVAMVFGEYFSHLVWGHATNVWASKAAAGVLIVILGMFNIVGVQVITTLLSVASVLKMGVVAFLISCGITVLVEGGGHIENFHTPFSFEGSSTNPTDYGLAFYYCLFTFQAWNSLNYMTEELKTPERTLPIGGLVGLLGVSVSYFLCNLAYLMMFSLTQIVQTNTIAMDSGFAAFGRPGEIIMSLGLLVSCLGCVGGAICCISRNLQCTADSGIFPEFMGGINKRFQTPVRAIIIESSMMCIYLLFDANALIPFFSTVEWLFYSVTFSVVLFLRYKEPNTHRPFKVPVFVSVVLFLVTGTFVILPLFSSSSRLSTLLGLCWLPFGSLVYAARYYYTTYRQRSAV
ncbi:hypothetical protein ACHWQZ_G019633 [Mnemiopsis leidyi]